MTYKEGLNSTGNRGVKVTSGSCRLTLVLMPEADLQGTSGPSEPQNGCFCIFGVAYIERLNARPIDRSLTKDETSGVRK